MKVLDAVARILKAEGIEWAGCFPSNNLIEAVAEVGINPIMFRQERGAAMAADDGMAVGTMHGRGVGCDSEAAGAWEAMVMATYYPTELYRTLTLVQPTLTGEETHSKPSLG